MNMKEIYESYAFDSEVYISKRDECKGSRTRTPKAYVERWKFEKVGSPYYGIPVSEEGSFLSILSISRHQGIYLGKNAVLTGVIEDKFYHHESWFSVDLIFTDGQLKENLTNEKNSSVEMDVNTMPKRTLTIISSDKEKIIKFANALQLPLEERASSPPKS